jgi:hypothetical protein
MDYTYIPIIFTYGYTGRGYQQIDSTGCVGQLIDSLGNLLSNVGFIGVSPNAVPTNNLPNVYSYAVAPLPWTRPLFAPIYPGIPIWGI